MAYFNKYGIVSGWWWYFQLRYVTETPEYKLEFEEELIRLIQREGEDDIESDDSKQERVSMRRMRSKVY